MATQARRSGRAGRLGLPPVPRHLVVIGGVALAMVAVWFMLALLYSGIGGGTNVGDVRAVMSTVTSTRATSGSLGIQGILATPEYFAVTERGEEFFGLAPEQNLVTLTRDPGAFDALDLDAAALGLQAAETLPVLLMVDRHEGAIPDPATWLPDVSLAAGDVIVQPLQEYSVAFRSEHHVTLALRFPWTDAQQRGIDLGAAGTLSLDVPDMVVGEGSLRSQWALPLAYPGTGGRSSIEMSLATFAAVVAIMGGLLVVFSPCALHMTAFFLPVVTGLGVQEINARKDDVGFRAHVAILGVAFVAGFVLLYTTFGVLAGVAGRFFADTAQLEPILAPIRIAAGAVVIYLGLQTIGVFRMPFVISLKLPGRPHNLTGSTRQGLVGAAIAGMTVSFGCLVCVGGTLLAALLVYAGTSSSPLTGGLTLFLFALGMSLPFLLAALAFDRILPRFMGARSVLHYSTPIAGIVMLVLGLLIISGNDNLFEEILV